MTKPIIGMLHLPPLPGAPRSDGDLAVVRRRVLQDASILVENGIQQLMLENYGDVPFYPGTVPGHVIAHMTALACEIKRQFAVPLGVNVLRNDGCAALSIAHAAGAEFIRVNILCGARVTDQGIIEGIAHDLLRLRSTLHAGHIRIWADVNVKHSSPLGKISMADEVEDVIGRSCADALIVTGPATGRSTCLDELQIVKQAAGDTPVYVGSGITAETIGHYHPVADGFIVGSWLKQEGMVCNPVDPQRVMALVQACH